MLQESQLGTEKRENVFKAVNQEKETSQVESIPLSREKIKKNNVKEPITMEERRTTNRTAISIANEVRALVLIVKRTIDALVSIPLTKSAPFRAVNHS